MSKQRKRSGKLPPTNGIGKKLKRTENAKEKLTKKHEVFNFSRPAIFGVIILCVTCIIVMLNNNLYSHRVTLSTSSSSKEAKDNSIKSRSNQDTTFEDFKPQTLNKLDVKSGVVSDVMFTAKMLQSKLKRTAVQAFVLEDFLSAFECDALARAHDNHVMQTSQLNPLLCFDSLNTFKLNLKELGMTFEVSDKDFLEGTTCVNESLSLLIRNHGLKWSMSTSFYPGESKFSLTLQERIKYATGLSIENGGKFQITSYPKNVGYKNHTDCTVGGDTRDRYATILVYLKNVAKGGETKFPQLGLSVKPKKGLALVWNSMSENGRCDPTSIHNAAQVIQGRKYILQRWYYYHNFPSLGKRMPEPSLPKRKSNQPRVSCDEYEFGSCRWYDEWNFDHIKEYVRNKHRYS